jgi:hypothetical protein
VRKRACAAVAFCGILGVSPSGRWANWTGGSVGCTSDRRPTSTPVRRGLVKRSNDGEEVAGKQPGFYLYPADLERELRPLPVTAQALWVRMLLHMHWASRRGYLEHPTGEPFSAHDIARMVGMPVASVVKMLDAMEHRYGTFSRDTHGVIFNRRMVRDTEISEKRRAAGRLGGNPNLVGNEVNHTAKQNGNLLNQTSNQNPTLSSSTSSSTSKHTQTRVPLASDQTAKPPGRWAEFQERYPRKQHLNQASQAYVSVVTADNESQVFACLDRYLDSDEVRRGVVANPDKWLFAQAADGWAGMWPARNGMGPDREYDDAIKRLMK